MVGTMTSGRLVVHVDFNSPRDRLLGRGFASLDDIVIARNDEDDFECDAVVVQIIPPGSGYGGYHHRDSAPLLRLAAFGPVRYLDETS